MDRDRVLSGLDDGDAGVLSRRHRRLPEHERIAGDFLGGRRERGSLGVGVGLGAGALDDLSARCRLRPGRWFVICGRGRSNQGVGERRGPSCILEDFGSLVVPSLLAA